MLLPRQSSTQATPGTSELLRALGARLNTTAGFSYHFHQEADRRLQETKRWKPAAQARRAQRRPRPSPHASSPRPFRPLGVLSAASPGSPEPSRMSRPAGRWPSFVRLLLPELGVQSHLLRGPESPPRLPQPSLSCKLLQSLEPGKELVSPPRPRGTRWGPRPAPQPRLPHSPARSPGPLAARPWPRSRR